MHDLAQTTIMFKLIACLSAACMLFAQVANATSDCESKAGSKAGHTHPGAAIVTLERDHRSLCHANTERLCAGSSSYLLF